MKTQIGRRPRKYLAVTPETHKMLVRLAKRDGKTIGVSVAVLAVREIERRKKANG